jgi:para-nitrobenzyl esterase
MIKPHVVQVEHGYLRGSSDGSISVFRSIPYAAPPIGAGRFEAPAPHLSWLGVRDATRPGPTAPQPIRGMFGPLDLTPYFAPGWVKGDDYLTVNIWAPRGQLRAAPVLVFLHGGGFVAGSSYSPLLDGRRFAENGVLVVTVNYRLGIAGFLDLPGAPANRGLLDVFAALRWVQRNIGAFGGDPNQVTLGGQSAGATLTAAAIAAADQPVLFHQAIMQSGSGDGAFTSEQAAIVTAAAAHTLDITPGLARFQNLSDEELVGAIPALMGLDLSTAAARDPLQKITPFSVVLPEQPTTVLSRGAARSVDLLIGHNTEEGNLYLVPLGRLADTSAAELQEAAAYAHPDPAELVSIYSSAHPTAGPGRLRSMLLGEAAFGAGSRHFADAHARTANRTYCYEFAWRSSALGGQLGATHVVEIPFAFDNLLPDLVGENKLLGPADPPQQLADQMHRAWTAFITDGSPGWPEYLTDARTTMRINSDWTTIDDPHRADRAAWA